MQSRFRCWLHTSPVHATSNEGNDEMIEEKQEEDEKKEDDSEINDFHHFEIDESSFSDVVKDDNAAFCLGRALTGSPRLKTLSLGFHSAVTTCGVGAIANGLKVSNVTQLRIARDAHSNPIPAAVRQLLLGEIIQIVPDLSIGFRLVDTDADQLEAKLIGNKNLKRLEICIGSNMSVSGAFRLATGLRHSESLERIELIADAKNGIIVAHRNVMRVLFLHAATFVHELRIVLPLNSDDVILLREALIGNRSLKTLSLRPDYRLSTHAIQQLALGLCHSEIIRLDVCAASSSDIKTAICEAVRDSQTIQHLSIGMNSNAANALQCCLPRLQSLEISGPEMDNSLLIRGLSNGDCSLQLSVLKLQPFLAVQDMQLLCAALPRLSCLKSLSINGDLTCEAVADYIDNVNSFIFSDLVPRNIQAIEAERLMIAVGNLPNLLQLDLSRSTDIGCLGIEMIGSYLPKIGLNELILMDFNDVFVMDPAYDREQGGMFDNVTVLNHDNNNEQDGEDEGDVSTHLDDILLARNRACQALVAGVRSNTRLNVNINSKIYFSSFSELSSEMNFYLELNKHGRHLLHTDHHLADGAWCRILSKCPNASVVFHFLIEQPHLLSWQRQ